MITGQAWKFNDKRKPGNMKSTGAERIWERSVVKNKLRYKEFYGDRHIIN